MVQLRTKWFSYAEQVGSSSNISHLYLRGTCSISAEAPPILSFFLNDFPQSFQGNVE
jgi:hypothetical protein